MKNFFLILIFITLALSSLSDPSTDLTAQIDQLLQSRNLRGIQIQIRKNGQQIYQHNKGIKNEKNESIDSNTVFRIASCSKSFSAVAIMQLVEQGKLKLNDTLTNILGFQIKNPHFPDIPITVEMILSHQSSITQPDTEYTNFLVDTSNAPNGDKVPHLKELLTPGGKYYNPSIFPANRKPGEYFQYSNLGFVIAGTVIEAVSQQRFDIYMRENILGYISEGLAENATYNIATIKNANNFGVIYEGKQGKWVPVIDNFNSTIPQRNLTTYKIGTNGAIYGPQGSMRASVRHMNNYMYVHANKGVTKSGKRLLSQQSINQINKPRYQYHGTSGGGKLDFHLYGFGIYSTSYLRTDMVIEHEVVRGHIGSAYGLISAYYYWKDYSYSYIINGALNGYGYDNVTIYEKERVMLDASVSAFIEKIGQMGRGESQSKEKKNLVTETSV